MFLQVSVWPQGGGRCTPLGRQPTPRADTPPPDGKLHPTGMHSCYLRIRCTVPHIVNSPDGKVENILRNSCQGNCKIMLSFHTGPAVEVTLVCYICWRNLPVRSF